MDWRVVGRGEEATWTARLPKQLRLLVLTSLLPSPPYKLPIELGEFVRPGHILMQHDDPISLLTLTHPFPPILYRSFILTLNPTYSFFFFLYDFSSILYALRERIWRTFEDLAGENKEHDTTRRFLECICVFRVSYSY